MKERCDISGPIHPLTGEPRRRDGHPRPELYQLVARRSKRQREIQASYDAARTTDEFKNYWANADGLDADSANSRVVRSTLVRRSRYEVANNGYADGMVQTHANYLVGTGPSLRLQTSSSSFNNLVETQWYQWAKATLFRRKLWCMAHAKVQDGEPVLVSKGGFTVTTPSLKRRLLREYLDGEPQANRMAFRFWHPLNDQEKVIHLLDAFPDEEE